MFEFVIPLILLPVLILGMILRFYLVRYYAKKDVKSIDDFNYFNKQIRLWASEITDQNKKYELMTYQLNLISTNSYEDTISKSRQIPKFRKYIEEKWGEYIPSLRQEMKQEIRDDKISKLLS